MGTTPLYNLPFQGLGDSPNGASLGEDLATAVETEISRLDDLVNPLLFGPNTEGWSHFSVGESTTSTTFVNLGAGSSVSFTKQIASTRLLVTMDVDFVTTSTGRGVEFAARISAADYLVASYHQALPAANVRLHTSGSVFVSGIAAGTYSIVGRWRAVAGAGTISRVVNDCRISCTITEVQL